MKRNVTIKKLKNLELSNLFSFVCKKEDLLAAIKQLTPAGKMALQFIVNNNECHVFRCNGFEEVLPVTGLVGTGIVKVNFQSTKKLIPLFPDEDLTISMTEDGLVINGTVFPYSK